MGIPTDAISTLVSGKPSPTMFRISALDQFVSYLGWVKNQEAFYRSSIVPQQKILGVEVLPSLPLPPIGAFDKFLSHLGLLKIQDVLHQYGILPQQKTAAIEAKIPVQALSEPSRLV